jgi:RNA polymerase sigma factor (TIGR02999 family)
MSALPLAEPAALAALFHEHYDQLRRIAHARLRKGSPLTLLDSVALVSEVFGKLGRGQPPAFENDGHFLAYVSSSMRSLVIDYVRTRQSERRGGQELHVTLDTGLMDAIPQDSRGLLDIDHALAQLEAADPRLASVVEMRFFAGFTEEEIAHALGVSSRTVKRDWEKARLMLAALLVE